MSSKMVFNGKDAAAALAILSGPRTPKASSAVIDVITERLEQKAREGWTVEHDDTHTERELARMGAAYVLQYVQRAGVIEFGMKYTALVGAEEHVPDDWEFKPKNPRRDLVRAAALIVAEIERLDRASQSAKASEPGK